MHLQGRLFSRGCHYHFLLESIWKHLLASNHIVQNRVDCPFPSGHVEKSKRIDFTLVRIYDASVSSLQVLKFNLEGRRFGMNLFQRYVRTWCLQDL